MPLILLSDHVLHEAVARGSTPALVDSTTGESVSFADLVTRADAEAAGLSADGLRPCDVVALMSHN